MTFEIFADGLVENHSNWALKTFKEKLFMMTFEILVNSLVENHSNWVLVSHQPLNSTKVFTFHKNL